MEIYNKLFKVLQHPDLILTANQRLIDFLQRRYADYQQTQKISVWFTPQMLTLETWLSLQWEKQLIQSNACSYRLLTKNQERMIWQSLIEKSDTHFLLADSTAKSAQHAWQLHQQWQLDNHATHVKQSAENCIWKTWVKHFLRFAQVHACIDFNTAVTQLIDLFRNKKLTAPQRIFLLGFAEINPQYKKLLHTLEQLGCQIIHFTTSCAKPVARRLSLPSTEIELQTMARWAYQCWQAGEKNIICAVPQLIEVRTPLIECFSEVFTHLHTGTLTSLPFNIAGGGKLCEFPVIHSALSLLQLKRINPLSSVCTLLRSPYLGYAQEEQCARAQCDMYLRRYAEHVISLDQLAQFSKQQACPRLSQLLDQFKLIFYQDNNIKQYPSQWASYFAMKLQTLAWPGQGHLPSEAYQLIERWSALLAELSSLDFILGEIPEETALRQLLHLANETLFQAQTAQDCPIQILGLLDTVGFCVDSLWVMGLDDHTWPASADPNPFLPYALQRLHALPHAANEREFYFSSLITQRLLNSATSIIVSHALQRHEHVLRPSALIQGIPSCDSNDLNLPPYQSMTEIIWATRRWEYYLDDAAPPLQTQELFSRSSQLLKSQAACPFQAFARFRLHAHKDAFPQAGLNRLHRGSLLHEVLANFWNVLGDQATLLKQSAHHLPRLIQQAIDNGIKKFSKTHPFTFQTQFIAIERARLQQRLDKIISLDKKRSAFKKVVHEKQLHFLLNDLALNLRIDRVDELPDGSLLIIDYKTGALPHALDWCDQRLDEPQLPLYCLAQPQAKGFAIIYLHSNDIKIKGLSETENGLSSLLATKKNKNYPASWSALLQHWQTSLAVLAQQFQIGFAKVDPKYGENTCRHCHLQLVCRINHHEKHKTSH
jgi:ATP-dependent helicase/nuclease subunit B